MQDKIEKIISQISEKSDRLCTKVERLIDVVELKTDTTNVSKMPKQGRMSKILVPVAAASATIGLVWDDARRIFYTAAACAAGVWIGLRLSNRNKNQEQKSSTSVDVSPLKSQLMSEIISASKAITAEWNEFIEARHEEVKAFVSSLNVDNSEKEEMLSKLYFYETIKVPYPAINTIIEGMTMNNISDVKGKIINELTTAIKNASVAQIKSYNSLK